MGGDEQVRLAELTVDQINYSILGLCGFLVLLIGLALVLSHRCEGKLGAYSVKWEEATIGDIVARNPGIDADGVRAYRCENGSCHHEHGAKHFERKP